MTDTPIESFRRGLENSPEHGGYETESEAIEGAEELLEYVSEDSFSFDGDPEDAADLVCAVYWWAAHCHSGQWSGLYQVASLASGVYRPAPGCSGPEPESMELDYYRDLCALSGGDVPP